MAAFKKGHAKVGGRKEGSKNKYNKPLVERLQALALELGDDPHDFLLRTSLDESIDMQTRMVAAKEVAQYMGRKLKSVEHTADDETKRVVLSWLTKEQSK